ncbi:MAG: ComEC/Rec2 family competence protein [bacterium]|nr:ComEC/Rec2 family competence protein [bacterium]
MQFRQLKLVHLVIILCLLVFASSTHSIASQKDGLLKVYFFDIGQGDAIFIETPSGQQILIDGGPDNKILQKLGEVIPFYDKDIDLVVVSHPHADHLAGLIEVLNRYEVKNMVEAKENYVSSEFKAWQEAVNSENTIEIEAISGKEIDLGNGVTLTILHPFKSVVGTETKTPHDDGVVAILKYKSFELLLTGDMEAKVERRLIMEGYDLDSDVLKVGHHGSKTSTTEEFLSAVNPEMAVIQVGADNRYGHPTSEVLERLENYGIKVYRNDVDGDIELVSDGSNYKIIKH